MKKLLVLMIIALVAFSIVACAKEKEEPKPEATPEVTTEQPAPVEAIGSVKTDTAAPVVEQKVEATPKLETAGGTEQKQIPGRNTEKKETTRQPAAGSRGGSK